MVAMERRKTMVLDFNIHPARGRFGEEVGASADTIGNMTVKPDAYKRDRMPGASTAADSDGRAGCYFRRTQPAAGG
jgi:hypothetical protein